MNDAGCSDIFVAFYWKFSILLLLFDLKINNLFYRPIKNEEAFLFWSVKVIEFCDLHPNNFFFLTDQNISTTVPWKRTISRTFFCMFFLLYQKTFPTIFNEYEDFFPYFFRQARILILIFFSLLLFLILFLLILKKKHPPIKLTLFSSQPINLTSLFFSTNKNIFFDQSN